MSVELIGKCWVVRKYTCEQKEPVEVLVGPSNTVSIETCKDVSIVISPDVKHEEFKDKKPEDCKIANVALTGCADVKLTINASVITAVDIINCNKVVVTALGSLGSVELSKSQKCQVHLNGLGPNDAALKTEFLHESCSDNQIVLPCSDKYGDTTKEFSLPHRIKTTFNKDATKLTHAIVDA